MSLAAAVIVERFGGEAMLLAAAWAAALQGARAAHEGGFCECEEGGGATRQPLRTQHTYTSVGLAHVLHSLASLPSTVSSLWSGLRGSKKAGCSSRTGDDGSTGALSTSERCRAAHSSRISGAQTCENSLLVHSA